MYVRKAYQQHKRYINNELVYPNGLVHVQLVNGLKLNKKKIRTCNNQYKFNKNKRDKNNCPEKSIY